MVWRYLQHRKHSCECAAGKPFAPIGEHDAGYRGRHIGKHAEFPYMSGSYQNEEIRWETVGYGAKKGKIPPLAHGKKQDVEACHHHKHQIGWTGKTKSEHRLQRAYEFRTCIRRRDLKRRHTAKQRVGPARLFAGLLKIGLCLLSVGNALHRVALL